MADPPAAMARCRRQRARSARRGPGPWHGSSRRSWIQAVKLRRPSFRSSASVSTIRSRITRKRPKWGAIPSEWGSPENRWGRIGVKRARICTERRGSGFLRRCCKSLALRWFHGQARRSAEASRVLKIRCPKGREGSNPSPGIVKGPARWRSSSDPSRRGMKGWNPTSARSPVSSLRSTPAERAAVRIPPPALDKPGNGHRWAQRSPVV